MNSGSFGLTQIVLIMVVIAAIGHKGEVPRLGRGMVWVVLRS